MFLVAQQLYMSSCMFVCVFFLFVTSIQIRTHKSKDKLTSPHTNSQDNIGFDLAKCAAQLLYGPVLVPSRDDSINSVLSAGMEIASVNDDSGIVCIVRY